jgi:hypothetical protein
VLDTLDESRRLDDVHHTALVPERKSRAFRGGAVCRRTTFWLGGRSVIKRRRFENDACGVARTLDAVGEWWTLLILRDALSGIKQFEEFRRALVFPAMP